MVPCGFVPHVNDNVLFLFHANDRRNIGDTGVCSGPSGDGPGLSAPSGASCLAPVDGTPNFSLLTGLSLLVLQIVT
jgi:hypothetical protein